MGGFVGIGVPVAFFGAWTSLAAGWDRKLAMAAFVLFSLFMAYCMIAAAIRQRVILRDSAIEVVNLFGIRRVAYADIAAKVRVPANYPVWALISAQGGKPVRFDMGYAFDRPFKDWLASVPEGDLKLLRRR